MMLRKIRDYFNEQKIDMNTLQAKTGLSYSTVYKLLNFTEGDKIRIGTIYAIVIGFEKNLSDFMPTPEEVLEG